MSGYGACFTLGGGGTMPMLVGGCLLKQACSVVNMCLAVDHTWSCCLTW